MGRVFEDRKVRKLIIMLTAVLSVGLLIKFGVGFKTPAAPAESNPPDQVAAEESQEIVVYVTGAVLKPGLVKLRAGARLADALSAAGESADANISDLNLAEKLKDGQKIVIPHLQMAKDAGNAGNSGNAGNAGLSANTRNGAPNASAAGNQSSMQSSSQSSQSTQSSNPGSGTNAKININTADEKQLDTLPGIGPAMAARIISFRTDNGPFTNIEALKDVPGIGDKKFAQLANLITVDQ